MTVVSPSTYLAVNTHGDVAHADVEYARKRVNDVVRRAGGRALFARVKLTKLPDLAVPRPAVVEANIDLKGRLIRAQVARPTMREAIDEVHDRLRDRMRRVERDWEAVRGARPLARTREWRHSAAPTERAPYFPRPIEEREIIRHKTFSLARMTVDEAAFDMEMLDYTFHLFVEDATGLDSVLYRTETGYRLAQVEKPALDIARGATAVTVSPRPAALLTLEEATFRLNETGLAFVFFRDDVTHRGCVLYHRYDGHYGLISPAG
jgi:ribosome-associated translation inhibitor RaiA